jgi:hypothetical protein
MYSSGLAYSYHSLQTGVCSVREEVCTSIQLAASCSEQSKTSDSVKAIIRRRFGHSRPRAPLAGGIRLVATIDLVHSPTPLPTIRYLIVETPSEIMRSLPSATPLMLIISEAASRDEHNEALSSPCPAGRRCADCAHNPRRRRVSAVDPTRPFLAAGSAAEVLAHLCADLCKISYIQ